MLPKIMRRLKERKEKKLTIKKLLKITVSDFASAKTSLFVCNDDTLTIYLIVKWNGATCVGLLFVRDM